MSLSTWLRCLDQDDSSSGFGRRICVEGCIFHAEEWLLKVSSGESFVAQMGVKVSTCSDWQTRKQTMSRSWVGHAACRAGSFAFLLVVSDIFFEADVVWGQGSSLLFCLWRKISGCCWKLSFAVVKGERILQICLCLLSQISAQNIEKGISLSLGV